MADEVLELCRRLIGEESQALAAAESARAGTGDAVGREELLRGALDACRERSGAGAPVAGTPALDQQRLASAVASELSAATAKLPERQREALALRELLGLSHEQCAHVLEIDRSAVAPLLARARLRLRAERRGHPVDGSDLCPASERALPCLSRRLDSEPMSAEDEEWLYEHLGECPHCAAAHAAMLEASVCYRVWRPAALI